MRRQDENAELTELATALPVGKNSSSVDKISVVRLTTAYLKFRNFLSEGRRWQYSNLVRVSSAASSLVWRDQVKGMDQTYTTYAYGACATVFEGGCSVLFTWLVSLSHHHYQVALLCAVGADCPQLEYRGPMWTKCLPQQSNIRMYHQRKLKFQMLWTLIPSWTRWVVCTVDCIVNNPAWILPCSLRSLRSFLTWCALVDYNNCVGLIHTTQLVSGRVCRLVHSWVSCKTLVTKHMNSCYGQLWQWEVRVSGTVAI